MGRRRWRKNEKVKNRIRAVRTYTREIKRTQKRRRRQKM
jgi:hypothetical protein